MTYEFIENKTLREYYEREGIELSDEAKAWLMYNNISTFDRRWEYLLNLVETLDDGWLKENITTAYEVENNHLKEFKTVRNDSVYSCEILYDHKFDGTYSIFSTIDNAVEFGINQCIEDSDEDVSFRIKKCIVGEDEHFIEAAYTRDGDMKFFITTIPGDERYDEEWFMEKLPEFPIPYKRGDVVVIKGEDPGTYGVCLDLVEGETSHDIYLRNLKENGDDPYLCNPDIWIDILDVKRGGGYCHAKNILDIEKITLSDIENDLHRWLVEVVISTELGNGCVGTILTYMKEIEEGLIK